MKYNNKPDGWKNNNATGNHPVYESWRHGQAAKGINTVQQQVKPHERVSFLSRIKAFAEKRAKKAEARKEEKIERVGQKALVKSAGSNINMIDYLKSKNFSDDALSSMSHKDISDSYNYYRQQDAERSAERKEKIISAGKKTAVGIGKGAGFIFKAGKWVLSTKEKERVADEMQQPETVEVQTGKRQFADDYKGDDWKEEMNLREEQQRELALNKKLATINSRKEQERLKRQIEDEEDNYRREHPSIFGRMGK